MNEADPQSPEQPQPKPATGKVARPKAKAARKKKTAKVAAGSIKKKKTSAPEKPDDGRGVPKRPTAKVEKAGADGKPAAAPAAPKKNRWGKRPDKVFELPKYPPMTKNKSLVIVESPAKAKTINRYLGPNYVVKASIGHVRDLPKSKLGIDPDNDFKPDYVTIRGKKNVIDDLKSSAAKAKMVYLAPDPDREGEAIAWHLKEALHLDDKHARRVTFNEITKSAVKHAFDNPREINANLVNAQQARRALDRLVGYKISPLLWKKVFRGLSAGRVQSVAVRLICEREREIKAFIPEEYWSVTAYLGKDKLNAADRRTLDQFLKEYFGTSRDGETDEIDSAEEQDDTRVIRKPVTRLPDGVFHADLKKWKGENPKLSSRADVDAILAAIKDAPYSVSKVETKDRKDRPKPPYITSTMQQAASIRLGYPARKTMSIAQRLYEGIDVGEEGPTGLITYMRTDSVHLSDFAVNDARELVKREYGDKYLPATPNFYKSAKAAQAAHEAIRPTSVARTPRSLAGYLEPEQLKLYTLIWERFVACQMEPAVYAVTTIEVTAGDALFRATGRRLMFDGHARVSGLRHDEAEQLMPELIENQPVVSHEIRPDQHFTQPPPRFSEASLVKTLEKLGIGRPSTYAAIIGTIQDRNYVRVDKRAFYATELGLMVNDILVANFQRIVDTDFTSKMEMQLDKIEEGDLDWVEVLRNFYEMFKEELTHAEQKIEKIKGRPAHDEHGAEVPCQLCGAPMLERWSRYGKFYGCSRFPECKGTIPLNKEGKVIRVTKEEIICPKCGGELVVRMSRRGPFLGCSTFPKCNGTRNLESEKTVKQIETEAEFAGIHCNLCGQPMNLRFFRGRPFMGCSGYPDCHNTFNVPKAKEALADGTLKQDEAVKQAALAHAAEVKVKRAAEEAQENPARSRRSEPAYAGSGEDDSPDTAE
ncbi:MAG: type I DNA topoisomerase [Planctomycetes bacterium]|nr:type I DNA topoisomerase [Planctomycetota bacterium]